MSLGALFSRVAQTSFASLVFAFLSAITSGALAQPANDAFVNAIAIQTGQVLTGTNVAATREPGEPDHNDRNGGGSVWWKFTPTVSKYFVVDLAGTNFTAIAGIYTGSSVGSLTEVAGGGSPFDPLPPRITFNATANTTYYIAVDGYNDGISPPATGNIRINRVLVVTPDANVAFEGPEGGPFTPFSVTFTLTAPAGPVDIEIESGPSWADADKTEIVGLHTTPVTVTLTPNDSARESTPGLYSSQVLFFVAGGQGGENRNIFLFVLPPSSGNRTISLSANPAAGGTVSGAGTFPNGSSRTVIATAAAAYLFTKWTEGSATVSTTPSYTFTLNANRTLVANFALKRTLSVSANPAAGGTVTGGGTFAHGSSRTVKATPKAGYEFLNWTEGANQVAITPSYTFALTANRTLRANFKLRDTAKNDLLVDRGAQGLYFFKNNATWQKIHAGSPTVIAAADVNGNGKDDAIFALNTPAASVGLWQRLDTGALTRIHTRAASKLAAGDVDNNGKEEVVGTFSGQTGTFIRRNGAGAFTSIHPKTARLVALGDLDGNKKADVLIVLADGIYVRYDNAGSWVRRLTAPPTLIATGDYDNSGKSDIGIGRGSAGVWRYLNNVGPWERISPKSASVLTGGDPDGDRRIDVLTAFPDGLWLFRSANKTWTRLHNLKPTHIAAADLDRNGKGEVIAVLPGQGLRARFNNTGTWRVLLATPQPQDVVGGGFD